MLKDILEENGVSVYRISQETGIPYSTLNDIVLEKTDIKNASANMLYRISKYLGVSMEYLYENSMATRSVINLYNEGRNVILKYDKNRIQYLGPKNLIAFHRVNKIEENVLYIDCYFEDDNGLIYSEEDYIDLNDILADYSSILESNYEVIIGKTTENTKDNIINKALLVSDSIAILYYADKNIPDRCVLAVSLARTSSKAIIRLKDNEIIESNMSKSLLNRALLAIKRNREEIIEDVEEVLMHA